MLIVGATILDGVDNVPIDGQAIWIENGRIKIIGPAAELPVPDETTVVDAHGRFAMPGMMDANIHLLFDTRMEQLVRFEGRFEDLIEEAAQVALGSGLTTVFDTWGPREPLIAVRDRINGGRTEGSRIFLAGNILGFDGPFSRDFYGATLRVASKSLMDRMNAIWVGNVGPDLMWMTPDQIRGAIRDYVATGIDFIKYGASGHVDMRFLAFSEKVQQAIIEEARRAGLTVQTHTTSVEALRIAAELEVDLLQHPELTGPVAIPGSTIERIAIQRTGCATLALTDKRRQFLLDQLAGSDLAELGVAIRTGAENQAAMLAAEVRFLMTTDGGLRGPSATSDPVVGRRARNTEDDLYLLGEGHFFWLKAMEQMGLAPRTMLSATTHNIAAAYGKDGDIGSIAVGKIADILILDKNPLDGADNYRSIGMVIKEGRIIDRAALPLSPILTNGSERDNRVFGRSAAV